MTPLPGMAVPLATSPRLLTFRRRASVRLAAMLLAPGDADTLTLALLCRDGESCRQQEANGGDACQATTGGGGAGGHRAHGTGGAGGAGRTLSGAGPGARG